MVSWKANTLYKQSASISSEERDDGGHKRVELHMSKAPLELIAFFFYHSVAVRQHVLIQHTADNAFLKPVSVTRVLFCRSLIWFKVELLRGLAVLFGKLHSTLKPKRWLAKPIETISAVFSRHKPSSQVSLSTTEMTIGMGFCLHMKANLPGKNRLLAVYLNWHT